MGLTILFFLPAHIRVLLLHPLSELFPGLREGFAWGGKKRRPIEKEFPHDRKRLTELFFNERTGQQPGGMDFAYLTSKKRVSQDAKR